MFSGFAPLAKLLIFAGIVMISIGLLILLGDRIPFIGKLPGDIYIKRENFTIYIPITTSIILSILLSVILSLFLKR